MFFKKIKIYKEAIGEVETKSQSKQRKRLTLWQGRKEKEATLYA